MTETTPTTVNMTANAKAKNVVAESIVRESVKPKGPTMKQFVKRPRPLFGRGGRDVS